MAGQSTPDEHPITIAPAEKRVRVVLQGVILAESTRALALRETAHPVVYYFPRKDVAMDLLEASGRASHCPYKGDAAYFTVMAHGLVVKHAAWSYENPLPGVAAIAGHIAFYPEKVDSIEVLN